jgi:uncharacterized membrane protein
MESRVASRVETVDLLRGLLMILMALDHCRDFFSGAGVNPTDALKSWPALFATRWVTHLCAPGFVALAGTSVYLQRQRGKSHGEVSRLLVTRGLWLIALEVTVISFSWSLTFKAPFFQVIWAVGAAMVVLAALQWLPTAVVGGVGAAIVLLHNLLDPITAKSLGAWANVWTLVHQPGLLAVGGKPAGFVAYPVLPWTGAILLGYAFGAVVVDAPEVRRRIAIWLGVLLLGSFAVARALGGYGDPSPWMRLPELERSVMSFLDVRKYPPSMDYFLATFGVLLLLFAGFDWVVEREWASGLRQFVKTYGEVPFFYYVLHIWAVHLATVGVALAIGFDWRVWVQPRMIFLSGAPAGWGWRLPVVYLVWAVVVLGLYVPCRWFSGYKRTHRHWWLSYV